MKRKEDPAENISMIYRKRWQIELFFKAVKQNLRIERFYGNSENAVRTQMDIHDYLSALSFDSYKDRLYEKKFYQFYFRDKSFDFLAQGFICLVLFLHSFRKSASSVCS
jgi:IS4 transposase